MKKLSQKRLAQIIIDSRKSLKMTQQQLAVATGINRALISRLESLDFIPSIQQLESLAEVLNFEPTDLFINESNKSNRTKHQSKNIAVAGTGYVGLSIAILLAQHNQVTAVDIIPEKVKQINNKKSPIQDDYIEKYLAEKNLNLIATTDGATAYKKADFVVIAAPTNYDSKQNYFDTSAVESVIELVLAVNPKAIMVIKSTVPVGYTESIREKYNTKNILFSPEFLRESKALYDNLYPSRIIVGTDQNDKTLLEASHTFADLRKPVVYKTFQLNNASGLSTALSSSGSVADVIQRTPVENLSILPSGPKPPNPSELLSSPRMDQILSEARQLFDVVIFDMPPVVAVTDAQIMSSKTDGTLLVVRENTSRKESLTKAKELLEMAQARVLGVVYNGAEHSKDAGYYYGN